MDIVALLQEVREARMTVVADGAELVVRGPRRLEALARKVITEKAAIVEFLNADLHQGSAKDSPQAQKACTRTATDRDQPRPLDERPATEDQLRLWLLILKEEGVQFRMLGDEPVADWTPNLERHRRPADWARHRVQLARILQADPNFSSSGGM